MKPHGARNSHIAPLDLALVLLAVFFTPCFGCGSVAFTSCPSAAAAAAALTGSSALLPISGATFSGACTTGSVEGMLLISAMGCHYLAASMPSGKACSGSTS